MLALAAVVMGAARMPLLLNYKNFNYDMRSNGEQWLLRKLAAFRPRVVFQICWATNGIWHLCADLSNSKPGHTQFALHPICIPSVAQNGIRWPLLSLATHANCAGQSKFTLIWGLLWGVGRQVRILPGALPDQHGYKSVRDSCDEAVP